jgi:hypothetical protein
LFSEREQLLKKTRRGNGEMCHQAVVSCGELVSGTPWPETWPDLCFSLTYFFLEWGPVVPLDHPRQGL